MADIEQYLKNIMSAVYGEEVRGSIHDAIEAINNSVYDGTAEARGYAEEAQRWAEDSEQSASDSKTEAGKSQTAREGAEAAKTAAEQAQDNAQSSASAAASSAKTAGDKATEAENYATLSKSWAVGGTSSRQDESTTNAKYFADEAKKALQSISGQLVARGTITFEQLKTVEKQVGYMYNISNDFITDSSFMEGAGHSYAKGTNVYYTSDSKWDCLAAPDYIKTIKVNGTELVPDAGAAVDVKAYNEDNKPEVGGRNYILDSKNIIVNQNKDYHSYELSPDFSYDSIKGKTITLSVYIKAKNVKNSAADGLHRVGIEPQIDYEDGSHDYLSCWFRPEGGNLINYDGRISATYTVKDINIIRYNQTALYCQNLIGDELICSLPKIEFGEIATDWTPAPEDKQDKIDLIGGRNYIRHSSPELYPNGWSKFGRGWESLPVESGYVVSSGWEGNYVSILSPISDNKALEYGTYTLGFTAYLSNSVEFLSSGVGFIGGENGTKIINDEKPFLSTSPQRYEFTFEISKDNDPGSNWRFAVLLYNSSQHDDVTLYLKDAKLEKGNIPTDWTPAPEDLEPTAANFKGILPIEKGGTNSGGYVSNEALSYDEFNKQINQPNDNGKFICLARHNATNDYWQEYSSGIKFGMFDTSGYITANYREPRVDVGGGSEGKINWHKQLAFKGDNLSQFTNNSGFITSNDIPEGAAASNTVPKAPNMAGNVGNELAFARGDHIHPYGNRELIAKGTTTENDLNNLVASGVYFLTDIRKKQNIPQEIQYDYGFMIVFRAEPGSNEVLQIIINNGPTNNKDAWFRTGWDLLSSPQWSAWHKFALSEDITASETIPKAPAATGSVGNELAFARGDHVHPMQPGIGNPISIPANADLNDYSTAGAYYCRNNVDAGTITNKPYKESRAFSLTVIANSGFTQIFMDYINDIGIWVRNYESYAGWGGWKKIVTRSDYATASKPGLIKPGTGCEVTSDGTLNVTASGGISEIPVASATTLGGVKVGDNMKVTEDGTLTANLDGYWSNASTLYRLASINLPNIAFMAYNYASGSPGYVLPTSLIASKSNLGLIKIGTGLTIDTNGVVSANTSNFVKKTDVATFATPGLVKPGSGLSLDNDGTLSVLNTESGDIYSSYPTGIAHRNMYRGKSLGTSVTDAQFFSITRGTFEDIFVGDYWTIDGVDWVVADFDRYYYSSLDFTTSGQLRKHHVIVIPSKTLYSAQMDAADSQDKGYDGTDMKYTGLTNARTQIKAAFPDKVLSHPDYWYGGKSGNSVQLVGQNVDVQLMSSTMVYGVGAKTEAEYAYMIEHKFALFDLNPDFIVQHMKNIWFRDYYKRSEGGVDWYRCIDTMINLSAASCLEQKGVYPFFCIGSNT